jgi:hypothetical protein
LVAAEVLGFGGAGGRGGEGHGVAVARAGRGAPEGKSRKRTDMWRYVRGRSRKRTYLQKPTAQFAEAYNWVVGFIRPFISIAICVGRPGLAKFFFLSSCFMPGKIHKHLALSLSNHILF